MLSTSEKWLKQDGGISPIGLRFYLMTISAFGLVEASGLKLICSQGFICQCQDLQSYIEVGKEMIIGGGGAKVSPNKV